MDIIRYSNFGNTQSPFSNVKLKRGLEALGFVESSLAQAALLVCRNLRNARIASTLFPWKQVIIWTNEPRFSDINSPIKRGWFGRKIHVFNVFTGNVFFHNHHFFSC